MTTREQSSEVRVYAPGSVLRSPIAVLAEMFRDCVRARGLAWRLFIRDTRARYRQSMLGYLWAFLPPLATTASFVLLNGSGIIAPGTTVLPYAAFVVLGTVLWQTFADAVMSPIRTTSAARPMLAKVNFPREALLIAGLLDVFFNFLVRAFLIVPVFAYYGIVPAATMPCAVLGVVLLIAFGFALGLLFAPIGLLYTDIGQGLGLALSFWMLVTPVVYSAPQEGLLARISSLNPVSPLITGTRDVLVAGIPADLTAILATFVVTVALLFAGWLMYRLAMPVLVERMGV